MNPPRERARGGFMVTPNVLALSAALLARHTDGGVLYASSNVEDVAVEMARRVTACVEGGGDGGDGRRLRRIVDDADADAAAEGAPRGGVVPRRQAEYEAAGGERARGRGWLSASPLPDAARSENELACALAGKPIFRAAWRCRGPKRDASGDVEPCSKRPKKRAASGERAAIPRSKTT